MSGRAASKRGGGVGRATGAPAVRLGQGSYERCWPRSRKGQRAAARRRPEIPLDFLVSEPAAEYHVQRGAYLSSHLLADFRRCPLLYRQRVLGMVDDRRAPDMVLGSAAHALTLEGQGAFDAGFVVGRPIDPKTGKPLHGNSNAYKAWAATLGDREQLTESDGEKVRRMADAVHAHMFAAELLKDGVAEHVARVTYRGVPCQARFDWVNPVDGRGIVDLKTCRSLDEFERDIQRFEYLHQLAFYREVFVEACGAEPEAHLVAVEKEAPFRCGVWHVTRRTLDWAADENVAAIEDLTKCMASDVWPTRFESMRQLDLSGIGR